LAIPIRGWLGSPIGNLHFSILNLQLVVRALLPNCYDNAAMEAFWSTLKREALAESSQWSESQVSRGKGRR
jgi:hypothetical protein